MGGEKHAGDCINGKWDSVMQSDEQSGPGGLIFWNL